MHAAAQPSCRQAGGGAKLDSAAAVVVPSDHSWRSARCSTQGVVSDRWLSSDGHANPLRRHRQRRCHRQCCCGRERAGQPSGRRTKRALPVAAAWLLLVAVAGPAAASVPADDTYTGMSYITPQQFPCPSDFKCDFVLALRGACACCHMPSERTGGGVASRASAASVCAMQYPDVVCSAEMTDVLWHRLITENVEVVYGPNVLLQRIQTEVAYLNATEAILVPSGVCNRWTNYTAHPSQTPGAT